MGIYEELVGRGLIAQVTNEDEIREMVNNGKATFYIGFDCTADSLHVGLGIMKERATFITDLWDLTSFFFVAPAEYEEKQTRKYWKGQNPEILRELRSVLAAIDDFSLENTERIVHGWIEQKGYGMGQVMNTLRLALVGAGKGPGMYDVTSFIGKEETLRRIDHILATLKPAE